MSLRIHKIKLKPNGCAVRYFNRACGIRRFAFNWAYQENQKEYRETKKSLSGYDLVKRFNSCKAVQFPWTAFVTKWAPQKAIQDFGEALKRFFKKKSLFPKLKKKGKCRDSFYLGIGAFKITGKRLHVPKLGKVKMTQELRFAGVPKSVTISKTANEWFAAVSVEVSDSVPYAHECKTQAVIGVDLGLRTFAMLSDGSKREAPKALSLFDRRLKHCQQSLHRKVKGSRNRFKARMCLAKVYSKVANVRADFIHKLTSNLVSSYRFIGIEDLAVKNMVKNRSYSKSLSNAAFGEFRRQLEYKARYAGAVVVVADRFFPSSKTCSDCGFVFKELKKEEHWTCMQCGALHDRDINAAKNLEQVARRYWETQNACGEDVRPALQNAAQADFGESGIELKSRSVNRKG
jgi:putative transposase